MSEIITSSALCSPGVGVRAGGGGAGAALAGVSAHAGLQGHADRVLAAAVAGHAPRPRPRPGRRVGHGLFNFRNYTLPPTFNLFMYVLFTTVCN